MYPVSTVNLSPDATQADAAFGTQDRGDLRAGDLIVLLENFRRLDGAGAHELEPHLILIGRSGKFHVRTGQGKLFLYNARALHEPYAELTAAEIIAQLDREEASPAPWAGDPRGSDSFPLRPAPAPHRAIAAAILAAGLALNAYTLWSVFYTATVNDRPPVALLTDAAEAAARQREIAGTYRTGDRPGDRVIVVQPAGGVRFSEIGRPGGAGENTDTYQLGHHEARLCLSTAGSGVIDVVNLETLLYYGDTYRRR